MVEDVDLATPLCMENIFEMTDKKLTHQKVKYFCLIV